MTASEKVNQLLRLSKNTTANLELFKPFLSPGKENVLIFETIFLPRVHERTIRTTVYLLPPTSRYHSPP
jgi:hypothetical protein